MNFWPRIALTSNFVLYKKDVLYALRQYNSILLKCIFILQEVHFSFYKCNVFYKLNHKQRKFYKSYCLYSLNYYSTSINFNNSYNHSISLHYRFMSCEYKCTRKI